MNTNEDFDENLHELNLSGPDGPNASLVAKKKKRKKKKKCSTSTSTSIDPLPFEGVETILGYEFSDPRLLEEALTHPSSNQCVNYDRLEFIGDAVINWLMSKKLFLDYPELGEDRLTPLRSANVSNEKFARISVEHELYPYLRFSNESFKEQIKVFKEEIYSYPLHCNSLIKTPKFLADIFESLIGAVFMDSKHNLDTVFMRLLEPLISPEELQIHPKTELQVFCQKKGLPFNFNEDYWEQHHIINVIVDSCVVGTGYGSNKEIAQNQAAKAALDNITLIYLNPVTEATAN
ncbi:hypothetical protein HHK36_003303 [Tetracentron sinense]|uniref:Uncharacterized protein n=1 Tax=Tetracentron sinense TaxID=13715 RepID=A0A834ZXD0_TETSI|nr:hypothetical protein HHK36_003303 [Tetracentron sinense]